MSTRVIRQVEPVGLAEVADRLGLHRQTTKQWHLRKLLPPPGPGTVSGAPWWDWAVIEEWARKTGRLSEPADITPEG